MTETDHQPTFLVGSLVRLRSGGPIMTVVGLAEEVCRTAWFVGETLRTGEFPVAALLSPEPREMSDEQLQAAIDQHLGRESIPD